MKKIILSFVLCSLALMGAAQKFKIEKLRNFDDIRIVSVQNIDSVLSRYNTKSVGAPRANAETQEKLHKALFGQVVTPQMKKIFKQRYSESGRDECLLNVDIIFEKATGKIVDVSFVISAGFLEAFTEKNLREMYRRLMKLSIDTAGMEYSSLRQGEIAAWEFFDFLKYALEGK